MRKIYTSLMLLAMLTVSMVAKAQYSAVINADPTDDYVAGQQSFDAAAIVSALGLEDFSALKTMVDAGGALYLKVGEEKSNVYTGETNEWWMNLEGTPQGYGDEGTSWFVGLKCEAAGVDKETGDEWPDRVNVYVGQMPKVYTKTYTASTLKATIYLVNGDKQVSFDVTQNVTAAVKPNLPEPTTKLSELTIVADYELKLPFLVGKSYEGKTYSATLEGLYEALGVEDAAALDASIADYVFTQTVKSEETAPSSGEYIHTPTDDLLTPDAASGGAWYGRYSNYNETEGTEEPLPLSYPKAWGAGCTFYTQSIKLANSEYSIVSGQYPGTMKEGDTDYTYHYIVYGNKAARVKIQVEVTKPEEVDPSQLVKVEEELTVTVEQEPLASGYATQNYTFDVAKVAELLECEVSDIDSWKVWATEVGGTMMDYADTNDGYIGGDGFPMTWSDGGFIYIQPVSIPDGTFRVGQRGGMDPIKNATVEEPLLINTALLFVHGTKYVVVNVDIKIAPDENAEEPETPDDNFGEIVATIPLTFEMKPAGDYYGNLPAEEQKLMELDLGIDNIKLLLGEGTYNVWGLTAPASAEAQPKLTAGTGYGPNTGFDSGFWMAMPSTELGDEYVNTAFVGGWGTNSFGIEWKLKDGIFGFDQIPGQRAVGDTYNATFYYGLADKSKAIKYELTVKYVEEPNNAGNEANIVANIGKMILKDEAEEGFGVKALILEALGIDESEWESVVPKVANSAATYATVEDGFSDLMRNGAIYTLADGQEAPEDCYYITYEDDAIELDPMEIPFATGDESKAVIKMAFDYTDAESVTSRVLFTLTVVSENSPLLNINGIGTAQNGKATYYTLQGTPLTAPVKGLAVKKVGNQAEVIYVK